VTNSARILLGWGAKKQPLTVGFGPHPERAFATRKRLLPVSRALVARPARDH
jgi:hypothetical protein